MAEEVAPYPGPARSKDEIALELTKFIALNSGYGKGAAATGYTAGAPGKAGKGPEEYAESILQLFERCRTVVGKQP